MVEPKRSRRLPDHRCTYVDAATGQDVAEIIGPEDWPRWGPQPMRRGCWYRCSRNCGVFIYVPLQGRAIHLRLPPGATLDEARRRLARQRRSPPT